MAIADSGSFSAAAAALHTVQSNVSSHVARLERELGAELVDRRSGQLTEEGLAVVERGRRIMAELEAAATDVAALRNEVAGIVRIGMIGTTARWLTPLLLEAMKEAHPKVRLVVGEGTSATLEPNLAAGSLDAAVVNIPQGSPDLVEHPLFDEDLILVVAADHPFAAAGTVELAELDGFELLLPAPGSAFREEIDEACKAMGVVLAPTAELDGVRLMASLSMRGLGPAILPATGASEAGRQFARVSVNGLPRRKVGLVTRRRGRPSAPARAALQVLQDVVRDNLDPARGVHPPGA